MLPDFENFLADFRQQLRAEITAEVVKAITPIVHAASNQPGLVDRHRMAELLSISVPRLDTMVRGGAIPSKLIGSRRLFHPGEVIAAIPNVNEKREANRDD